MAIPTCSDGRQTQPDVTENSDISLSLCPSGVDDNTIAKSTWVEDGSEDDYIRGEDVYAPSSLPSRSGRHNLFAAWRRRSITLRKKNCSPFSSYHDELPDFIRSLPCRSGTDEQRSELVTTAPTSALLRSPSRTGQCTCPEHTSENSADPHTGSEADDEEEDEEKEEEEEEEEEREETEEEEEQVPNPGRATFSVPEPNTPRESPAAHSSATETPSLAALLLTSDKIFKDSEQLKENLEQKLQIYRLASRNLVLEHDLHSKNQELEHIRTEHKNFSHELEQRRNRRAKYLDSMLARLDEMTSLQEQLNLASEQETAQLKAQNAETTRLKDRNQIVANLLSRALERKTAELESYKVHSYAARAGMARRMIEMERERRDQVRTLRDELDCVKAELRNQSRARHVAEGNEPQIKEVITMREGTRSANWSLACEVGEEQEHSVIAEQDKQECGELSDFVDVGAELLDDTSSSSSTDELRYFEALYATEKDFAA